MQLFKRTKRTAVRTESIGLTGFPQRSTDLRLSIRIPASFRLDASWWCNVFLRFSRLLGGAIPCEGRRLRSCSRRRPSVSFLLPP
eukprot:8311505-Pyramimonas_sp.AAC.1